MTLAAALKAVQSALRAVAVEVEAAVVVAQAARRVAAGMKRATGHVSVSATVNLTGVNAATGLAARRTVTGR